MRHLVSLAVAFALGRVFSAHAGPPPADLKIGHLYASTGAIGDASMAIDAGIRVWVAEMNSEGGVFVKPFGKRIPVRLIDYDDHGSAAEAAALTAQLITQDKVDALIGDAGSTLTAAEAPVALANKMLLFVPDGTGAKLYSAENPYIVLCAVPDANAWAQPLAGFLAKDAVPAGIHKLALLYGKNDIDEPRADALRAAIKASGAKLDIVYDKDFPPDTSSYGAVLADIAATKPDAVIELGSTANDEAFLRDLKSAGQTFRMTFALAPGREAEQLGAKLGEAALTDIFTSVTAADMNHKPDFGMSLADLQNAWARLPDNKIDFGWNGIVGYTTALIAQEALATTDSMAQLDLRRAVFAQSGKLHTVDGTFMVNNIGQQTGESPPVGQLVANGSGGLTLQVVYPQEAANAVPVFGKP